MNSNNDSDTFFEINGYCPICAAASRFVAYHSWFRDHFACTTCGSLPRERAIMSVIEQWSPAWTSVIIHESSPSNRATSARLRRDCAGYIGSQLLPHLPPGAVDVNVRNENLECLTFADETIDLHITQDVLEHVLDPAAAFREIARTLKPGGLHIFTVPLVRKILPSQVRARRADSDIFHYLPEAYHGNPVGDGFSLVTTDWGYDICNQVFASSGLFTCILGFDDLQRGLRAEFLEVLVTVKPHR